jgi:hypothetical protein
MSQPDDSGWRSRWPWPFEPSCWLFWPGCLFAFQFLTWSLAADLGVLFGIAGHREAVITPWIAASIATLLQLWMTRQSSMRS